MTEAALSARLFEAAGISMDPLPTVERRNSDSGGFIAVVESRPFLRECIRRSFQSAFSELVVVAYSTLSELEEQMHEISAELIVLSMMEDSGEASANVLKAASELIPRIPVIVFAPKNEINLARTAIRLGAKGYFPYTMDFEIAVKAVRFVLAGGTYVPTDYLLDPDFSNLAEQNASLIHTVTAREIQIIRAIQEGKSNKAIANEFKLSLSTVKIHVRSIMKKWKAKNRTEVAILAKLSKDILTDNH